MKLKVNVKKHSFGYHKIQEDATNASPEFRRENNIGEFKYEL